MRARVLCIELALALLFIVAAMPQAQAVTAHTKYNCSNGVLLVNHSAVIDGTLTELWVENVTCAHGCSVNGVECNDPANVDQAAVSVACAVFLVFAIVFLILSQRMEIFNKKYYMMKYFYLGVSFVYMIMVTGVLANLHILGQDNIANILTAGQYVLVFTVVFTAVIVFVTHLEEWYKAMRREVGDR